MRKFVLPLLASLAMAPLAIATPALANEARVEARGGVTWLPGDSEATTGVAAGYDFDLGPGLFTGMEVSADKVLTGGTKTAFGFSGRAGANVVGNKVYAVGGYTTEYCDGCSGAWHLGAGVEHNFAGPIYGKVEYRHLFSDAGSAANSDNLMAGVGIKF